MDPLKEIEAGAQAASNSEEFQTSQAITTKPASAVAPNDCEFTEEVCGGNGEEGESVHAVSKSQGQDHTIEQDSNEVNDITNAQDHQEHGEPVRNNGALLEGDGISINEDTNTVEINSEDPPSEGNSNRDDAEVQDNATVTEKGSTSAEQTGSERELTVAQTPLEESEANGLSVDQCIDKPNGGEESSHEIEQIVSEEMNSPPKDNPEVVLVEGNSANESNDTENAQEQSSNDIAEKQTHAHATQDVDQSEGKTSSPHKGAVQGDNEDDDIILVSETPRDGNKKPVLASVYKCVRCGHLSKTRTELNKHLLQSHKLIIVSKQKSVDCLFCAKKLEMADLHQHLRTVHKVLLVRSTQNSKNAKADPQSDKGAPKTATKSQPKPSEELIDITSDNENEEVETSESQKKNDGETDTGRKEVDESSKSSNSQASTSIQSTTPKSQKINHSSEGTSSLALRRTPRSIVPRKYAEYANSSTDDEYVDDACVIDDDDDYSPETSKSPAKPSTPNKSDADILKTTSAGPRNKTVHFPVLKQGSLASGQKVVANKFDLSSNIAKKVSIVAVNRNTISAPTSVTNSGSVTTTQTGVSTTKSTVAKAPLSSTKVAQSTANQIVRVNGKLYNMADRNGTKYLIPLSTGSSVLTTTTTSTVSPPVVKSLPNVISASPTSNTGTSHVVLRQPVNNSTLSVLNPQRHQVVVPQLSKASPVVVQAAPQTTTLPPQQNTSVVVHVPPPVVPTSSNVLLQSNLGQVVSVPQTLLLQSSTLQPGQTLLFTIPPNQVGNTNVGVTTNTMSGSLAGIQQNKPQSSVPTPTTSHLTKIQNLRPAVTHTSEKSVKLAPVQLVPKVSTLVPHKSMALQLAKAAPPVTTGTSNNSAATSDSVLTKTAPVRLNLAKSASPVTVNIAKPKEVKSSHMHKCDGLFALEVCLDTAVHPGTEPKKEPRMAYIVQEKITVFEEPATEVDGDEESVDLDPIDAEKAKLVIAMATARNQVLPNDLTKLSDEVFFECPRCGSCFPQHLQLTLHVKHCSKLTPSTTLNTKIHAPLAVLDAFFEPTGRDNFYVTCRVCRARIVRTNHDYSVRLAHLVRHIKPLVELSILPRKEKKTTGGHKPTSCTAKSMEWVDYIVPPFTMDNAPTSVKGGSLHNYVSTKSLEQPQHKKSKKKKKKKKSRHRHRYSTSESDGDDSIQTSYRSLRSNASCYYGTLRPKDVTREGGANHVGNNATSSSSVAGNLVRGGRTMMHSFRSLQSPNKVKSTLTAHIPMKAKYRTKAKQEESTRRWNNGKTMSQLRAHWRRPTRRFFNLEDSDAPTQNMSPEEIIQVSSDEDDHVNSVGDESVHADVCDQDPIIPQKTPSPVTLTEDDISDYLKIIDEGEDMQTIDSTAASKTASKANRAHRQSASDLLDYYGNDVESTLTCEPLIMEPEQVLCYFKKSSGSRMKCQLRGCGTEVSNTIRAMLAHIRVHFQILVPLQMLAKCGSQVPRQSIPRPLRLTFSQVEAHFTLGDTEEANLRNGEVQQVYTCMWTNCYRSKCYKKTICSHLIKHIFFTLISKEEYQSMSKTMSAFSLGDDTAFRKLKIVAINKLGQKVCKIISVPVSQTETPQALKAAIKKTLDSDSEPLRLPSSVLSNIATKFASPQEQETESKSEDAKEGDSSQDFLTPADVENLKKKFPTLLEKWNIRTDADATSMESGMADARGNTDLMSDWVPKICDVRSLTQNDFGGSNGVYTQHLTYRIRSRKTEMPRWKSPFRREVPVWKSCPRISKTELSVIDSKKKSEDNVKNRLSGNDFDMPPNKKRKVACDGQDQPANASSEASMKGDSRDCDTPDNVNISGQQEESGRDEDSNKELAESGRERMEDRAPPAVSSEDDKPIEHQDDKQEWETTDEVNHVESEQQEESGEEEDQESGRTTDSNNKSEADTGRETLADSAQPTVSNECDQPEDHQDETEECEMTNDVPNVDSEQKAQVSAKVSEGRQKATLLYGLSSAEIVRVFRFKKNRKNVRVRVSGRGSGLGTFHCRMENCRFFVEAMTQDRKVDIVRSLALHLKNKHVKGRSRAFLFFPRAQSPAIPRADFLKLFEDASPTQDFKKRKIGDKFICMPASKGRMCEIEGRKLRFRGRFYKCRDNKCYFGYLGRNRKALVAHLRTHLFQAQVTVEKDSKVTVDCNAVREEVPTQNALLTAEDTNQQEEFAPGVDQATEGVAADVAEETRYTSTPCEVVTHNVETVAGQWSAANLDVTASEKLREDCTEDSQEAPETSLEEPMEMEFSGILPPSGTASTPVAEMDTGDSIAGETEGLDNREESMEVDAVEAGPNLDDEPTPAAVNTCNSGDLLLGDQDTTSAPVDCNLRETLAGEDMDNRASPTVHGDDVQERTNDINVTDASNRLVAQELEETLEGKTSMQENIAERERQTSMQKDNHNSGDTNCCDSETAQLNAADVPGETGDSSALPLKDMANLMSQPGDTIDMFFDELESYFINYTTDLPSRKGLGFAMKCYKCPKCEKINLRGSNLPDHLKEHIGKDVQVTFLDNIHVSDSQSLDDSPEPAAVEQTNDSDPAPQSSSPTHSLSDCHLSNGCDDGTDILHVTEKDIVETYFTKGHSTTSGSQVPFYREVFVCRQCQYRTMTIMDTPKHVEQHIKKKVCLIR